MKIYTEVIMEWNEDKGELVEVSSESYEHEGSVALCGGGGGGRRGTPDPVDPHPFYFAEQMGQLPLATLGSGQGGALPSHLAGKDFGPAVHPFYRMPVSDMGTFTSSGQEGFGYFAGMDSSDLEELQSATTGDIYSGAAAHGASVPAFSFDPNQPMGVGNIGTQWIDDIDSIYDLSQYTSAVPASQMPRRGWSEE